jgi:hypothetical protein
MKLGKGKGVMAAMIVFSAFCAASIVFLLSFFVALWNDRKWSRYVLKVHREVWLEAPPDTAVGIDSVTSRNEALSIPLHARAR